MIEYKTSLDNVHTSNLEGFFVGWPSRPSLETHFKLLQNSNYLVLALDDTKVVGFITAISDKTLSAYIPFLEVLPSYQKQGIGQELLKRMLELLKDFYMVDLLCDEQTQIFYQKLGMDRATGMKIRNYSKQKGVRQE